MKNLSLAMLAIGVVSILTAFTLYEKSSSVSSQMLEAAQIVKEVREKPSNPVIKEVVVTKYVIQKVKVRVVDTVMVTSSVNPSVDPTTIPTLPSVPLSGKGLLDSTTLPEFKSEFKPHPQDSLDLNSLSINSFIMSAKQDGVWRR